MERITSDECRLQAAICRAVGAEGTAIVLEKAAETIDEMDKDIAVFESRDYDNQQGG